MSAYRYKFVPRPANADKAERLVVTLAGKLGIPAPRVRWFSAIDSCEHADFTWPAWLSGRCDRRVGADGRVTIELHTRIAGDPLHTVAHELRHAAQVVTGDPSVTGATAREADARDYALWYCRLTSHCLDGVAHSGKPPRALTRPRPAATMTSRAQVASAAPTPAPSPVVVRQSYPAPAPGGTAPTFGDLAARLNGELLALLPERAGQLQALLRGRRPGEAIDRDALAAVFGAADRTAPPAAAGVAVIPVMGFIQQREDLWTRYGLATSTEALARRVRQAVADPSVKAIVFDVDSPGGIVSGTPEAAAVIHSLRGRKPMVAVSNTLMASAAYWLGSAGGEVVAAPSSYTGSIGVWRMHVDMSGMLKEQGLAVTLVSAGKHKVDGHPYAPLSAEVRARMQAKVDVHYREFLAAVARHRGVSAHEVREGFGEGDVLLAGEALEARLVDRVGTLEGELARLGAGIAAGRGSSARTGASARQQLARLRLELSG